MPASAGEVVHDWGRRKMDFNAFMFVLGISFITSRSASMAGDVDVVEGETLYSHHSLIFLSRFVLVRQPVAHGSWEALRRSDWDTNVSFLTFFLV